MGETQTHGMHFTRFREVVVSKKKSPAKSKPPRRSRKEGLPPGTLVYLGEKKIDRPRIAAFDFDSDQFNECQVHSAEECAPLLKSPATTWINVDGLHDVALLERLGADCGIHPLVLEDILNTDQRPKAEDYEKYFFIVLRMFHNDTPDGKLTSEQISLVLGPTYVLSFQEMQGDVFDPIRDRIRTGKGRVRKMGPDYLAYALMDAIVDGYFAILEGIVDKTEEIEDTLINDPSPETLHTLHHLKRQVLFLRKYIRPLRDLVSALDREDSPLIQKETHIYLRDLYDHVNHAMDTLETVREILMGMLDIYLSSVSNRMNLVMKVLTIIATIFIPLTFIAGIYGMNFEYMPELHWRWGYPLIWAVMLAILLIMLVFFRRKKWL